MHFETDYRLENYILNTDWSNLPTHVQERMKGCMIDLFGALIVGSHSRQFDAGLLLAKKVYLADFLDSVNNNLTTRYR